MFEEIEARRLRFDAHKPLSQDALARLDAVFEPWFIYGSNAIEGNTLSLGDTILIVREGKLPGGKSEEEYLEVKGQQDAYQHLRSVTAAGLPLSEKLVREFHQLLTGRLDPEKYRPGQYKDRDNQVIVEDGSVFPYLSHVRTPSAMQELVAWYHGPAKSLHPVERAAALHYKFILIHPFRDGNGRAARLLANFCLIESGHVMTIFRADERRRVYRNALRAVDQSVPLDELAPENPNLKLFAFATYLEQELLASYDLALDVLEGRVAVSPADLVRRFAGLEERTLASAGIGVDEKAQAELLAKSVQEIVRRVTHVLQGLGDGLNQKWKELDAGWGGSVDGAENILGSVGSPRREALGLRTPVVRGKAAYSRFFVRLRPDSPVPLNLPKPSFCDFVAYAEPHALTLASVSEIGTSRTTSSLKVALDPQGWRQTEIERFVLDRLNQFLADLQGELGRSGATPS